MLDEQIANRFIGHEKEIQLFEDWLDATGVDAPWIFFIHDEIEEPEKKGGVGKTWLLRKCANIAQQRQDIAIVLIDFFNVSDRNSAEIARRVVDSLKQLYSDWQPNTFEQAFDEYRLANRQNQNINDPLARLYDTLTSELDVLEGRFTEKKKHLLLFFDTFEQIEQYPVVAALNPAQIFPDTYTFQDIHNFKYIGVIIAGRNPPDWQQPNWHGREHELQIIPIEPFSLEEMVEFVNENRRFPQPLQADSKEAQKLHDLTQGRPILVGLVTDVLNYGVITIDRLLVTAPLNFEEYIVSKINELTNPINWIILFMAHIYHRFNHKMLVWLFDHVMDVQAVVADINTQDLWQKILELSFVRHSQSGDDITLHDEMRRLVNKYNWPAHEQPGGRFRHDLSHSIIAYYDQIIKEESSSRARQNYTVEQLYHRLFVNWNEGFGLFVKTFNRAISLRQNAFARSLLQEVTTFPHAHSIDQTYTLQLCEADLLRREESYAPALERYQDLEQRAKTHTSWFATNYAPIIYGISHCHLQMSHLSEALVSFLQAQDIYIELGDEARVGAIYSWLGYTHQRLGELEKAADYYDRSMAIHKKRGSSINYAATLSDRSAIYRLQGKYEEALRKANIALHIRQNVFNQANSGSSNQTGRGLSEISIGQSFGFIGAIYLKIGDLPLAQKFFEDAFEIFRQYRYKKGMATMYNRLGQIAIEKGNLDEAMQLFNEAYNTALNIDAEAEIGSLNKQGLVRALQNRLLEATQLFQHARTRAQETSDFYQQVESTIDLADTFEKNGQSEQTQQAIQEAEKIALPYKYYYLLGRIESIRAERAYLEHDHKGTFQHLGKYSYYMFLFNPVEYDKAVRRTMERLVALPEEDFNKRWEQLYQYWQGLHLDEEKSQMLYALEDVKDTMIV